MAELLVVISIIAILASLVLAYVRVAWEDARDARRLADMRNIQAALEAYYTRNSAYPGPVSSYNESNGACGGWDSSGVDSDGDGNSFITPLIDQGFMADVPIDPLDDLSTAVCGQYEYYRYNAGSYECPDTTAFFVLGVRDMEATDGAHPASPGWSCPDRNWQSEFDWVVGSFE